MDDQTDLQLLRAYSETRSDEAFATLVRRHIDLVHSAAMRMVCDSHLAQDVTQNTFVALAKNAPDLRTRPVITGWLHRTAQNIAAQTIRTDVRRRNREQEATAMNTLLSEAPDASWQEIAPHLDAALGQLDDVDRDAVLLRYFEKKSAREMAVQLGISDDAAQKRVSRAVERLREFFAKRGVTVGASGLAVVISANAVQAAPVGLAITISTAAALTGTTLATTATITAIKTIAMTTLQKTVITATLAVLAGVGIYEARQSSQLREQVQALQQLQSPLSEQVGQLGKALSDATNQLAALRDDNERLNRNTGELLNLRGRIGLLNRQLADGDEKNIQSNQSTLSSARDYYERAIRSDERDYESQLADLSKAIEMDPKFAEAYQARGNLYGNSLPLKKGGYALAAADYTRYLELKPDDDAGRFNRGMYFNQARQFDKAAVDFTMLIEKHPESVRAYLFRAINSVQTEDYAGAIADYSTVIRLDPRNKNGFQGRGMCYTKLGLTEEAKKDFDAEKALSN